MKKWLLAIMICFSFATLTAGAFLLPQTLIVTEQRQQEAQQEKEENKKEEDEKLNSKATVYLSINVYDDIGWHTSVNVQYMYAGTEISPSGSGYSYGCYGFSYQITSGSTIRFKVGAGSGYTLDKITNSSGTRVYPGDDGWYWLWSNETTSDTTFNFYGISGYTVNFTLSNSSWGYFTGNKSSLSLGVPSGMSRTKTQQTTASSSTYGRWYTSTTSYANIYAYANSGYVCYGWTESPSTTNINANRTVTANFTYRKYQVTLNPNGADGGITSNQTIYARYTYASLYSNSTHTNTTTASITNPTKSGYVFGGWSTSSSSSSGSIVINTSKALVANISGYTNSSGQWTRTGYTTTTLYARWSTPTYTLTANANGGSISSTTGWSGTGSTATKSLASGATYGTLPNVSRACYSFDGWYTSASGGTRVTTSTTMGSSSTTIYAHWSYSVNVDFYIDFYPYSYDGGYTLWDPHNIYNCWPYDTYMQTRFTSSTDITLCWNYYNYIYCEFDGGDAGYFNAWGPGGYRYTREIYIGGYSSNGGERWLPEDGSSITLSTDYCTSNSIYIYFRLQRVVNFYPSPWDAGSVSQYEVYLDPYDSYNVHSQGSTVYVDNQAVTATAHTSSSWTYEFDYWDEPDEEDCYPGMYVYAHFTKTPITVDMNVQTKVVGKNGTTISSSIPSGVSMYVTRYVGANTSSTGYTQTTQSYTYTSTRAGTVCYITITNIPAGYRFVGVSTNGSTRPGGFASDTYTNFTTATNIYVYFQEMAAPLYYTLDRGGYWYYEDGEYPQTFIGYSATGSSLPETIGSSDMLYGATKTGAYFPINGTNCYAYQYGSERYVKVPAASTGTFKLNNGSTASTTAGAYYWFRVDPIRWRVSNYGASGTDTRYANKMGNRLANQVGISDILGHGRVSTTDVSQQVDLTNWSQSCAAVGYSNEATSLSQYRAAELWADGSSNKIITRNIASGAASIQQAGKLIVANVGAIRSISGDTESQQDLLTYASDLSAVMQGHDYDSSTGWTSSLYNLHSGVVIGSGASTRGAYWTDTSNVFGFVYVHQAANVTICSKGGIGNTSYYTRINYVESPSSNGAYITTGLYLVRTNITRIEAHYYRTTANKDQCLFGNGYGNDGALYFEYASSSDTKDGFYSSNDGRVETINWGVGEVRSSVSLKNGTMTYTTNGTVAKGNYTPITTGSAVEMYLFGKGSGLRTACKLYSFKVWENGYLVRDYVPVLGNNGTYYLYDIINWNIPSRFGTMTGG